MSEHLKEVLNEFIRVLSECRALYVGGARQVVERSPEYIREEPESFVKLMEDLHRGLLLKIFISVSESDRQWCREESWLADLLLQHVWKQNLVREQLGPALQNARRQTAELRWYSLIRPFDQIPLLRERIPELLTIVSRVANLVAKADGPPTEWEMSAIRSIQNEIVALLHDTAEVIHDEMPRRLGDAAVEPLPIKETAKSVAEAVRPMRVTENTPGQSTAKQTEAIPAETKPRSIEESLAELDALIGIDIVKGEVRTLINFLRVQRERERANLPVTPISLHLVFSGNPGTGKTTVARILGQIFQAIGVLKKGHLVETDRTGLVAEYAGQTGVKANKKIDDALDGILFIDEAYSLVSDKGDDPFGAEAIQTLLKRMEDNRDRLIVILAGYPKELDRLLQSNPGLTSRFNHRLEFSDYATIELAEIFGAMCERNHYQMDGDARAKLLIGLKWLFERRDRHFGNGRLARNIFERAIRNLANRIVTEREITRDLLTKIHADDLEFSKVPEVLFVKEALESTRFNAKCTSCKKEMKVKAIHLGKKVVCKSCEQPFPANWGEPEVKPPPSKKE